jgi:hypothetical protein
VTDGTGTGTTPASTAGIFGTEGEASRSAEGSPSPMDDETA